MRRFQLIFSLIFFATLAPLQALAAACCGGGFAAPSLIAGDDLAQLTSSYSYTDIIINHVDTRGAWHTWDNTQTLKTFKLEGAHIIEDRFQIGFSLPILQRDNDMMTSTGLGDLTGTFAYEYLPDWNYNPFRPKGIGYIQLLAPTGLSRAESTWGGLDSRGLGFWALGLGTLLTKTWTRFDTYLNLDLHRSFSKTVQKNNITTTINPGFGGSVSIGLGYNFSNFRIGSSVAWTYEDSIETRTSLGSTDFGFAEQYATATLSFAALVSPDWSGTISISDQTLFGEPLNTSLGRSASVQIQRRWAR